MIQIKEEFKKLIPALTPEEFKQLEANCLEEGIREKIITWNGFIIDGHNRYEIATRWNLEYETESKRFDNELEVKIWMVKNQFGRRNLEDFVKGELMKTLEDLEKQKGVEVYEQKAIFKGNQHSAPLSIIDNEPKHNTRKIVADKLGWSTGKKAQFDVVVKKAPEEIKVKLRTGEVSINQAYQEIKKEEKKEQQEVKKQEYEQRVETVTKNEFKVDIFNTKEKFRIIYSDPAWSYNDKQDTPQLGGAAKHYNTMSVSEICSLPVNQISENDSVLFLWVTSPLLEDAFTVIKAWGFKYKTSFVWDKVKHNMGHYNSVRHEMLLIATKGSCTPDNKKLYDSVQSIERNDNHSEKPIEFLNIIDDLYNYGNKLEMFCRNIKKDKWYGWGNEI
jgi:N6-adenosine-specific RNA methylase IME4